MDNDGDVDAFNRKLAALVWQHRDLLSLGEIAINLEYAASVAREGAMRLDRSANSAGAADFLSAIRNRASSARKAAP